MTFVNTAQRTDRRTGRMATDGAYGYDIPSVHLFPWNRVLQLVLSQAGTHLLTKQFHYDPPGIHKSEGGINLPGLGDLVLYADSCEFEGRYHGRPDETPKHPLYRLAGLITNVVLAWDPNDPIESLIMQAAININCETKKLREVVLGQGHSTARSYLTPGDPLRAFFDRVDITAPQPVYAAFARTIVEKYWPKPATT
jgi:hypothetical protein